ncbi:hypothetical protein BJV82DRAFT_630886 [Fennellomyces sp. T-0311]|nr:hypothetical protein BJV82DRAFT_630886 [Fennellomyces sp. T-0311]
MAANAIEWVYNAGSAWTPLDQHTQISIEALWSRNAAQWIQSPSFGGNSVYIDTTRLVLMWSGYNYTIARRYRQQRHRR